MNMCMHRSSQLEGTLSSGPRTYSYRWTQNSKRILLRCCSTGSGGAAASGGGSAEWAHGGGRLRAAGRASDAAAGGARPAGAACIGRQHPPPPPQQPRRHRGSRAPAALQRTGISHLCRNIAILGRSLYVGSALSFQSACEEDLIELDKPGRPVPSVCQVFKYLGPKADKVLCQLLTILLDLCLHIGGLFGVPSHGSKMHSVCYLIGFVSSQKILICSLGMGAPSRGLCRRPGSSRPPGVKRCASTPTGWISWSPSTATPLASPPRTASRRSRPSFWSGLALSGPEMAQQWESHSNRQRGH